ncbi:MAG: DUF2786 domain-containing protein, partial [Acidimicrobiia bacterium]|nr:DUF2786 domain-containing protein [Acidimicrobiia bacterium]
RDRIVDRVRALLAKADSTDHEPERQAFLAKAQQLITRHHIEQLELTESDSTMGEQRIPITGWGNATRGVVNLYASVASRNRCTAARTGERNATLIIIVGSDTDRELTVTLVDHLLPQLRHDLLRDKPRSRMSYAVGWSIEVADRLTAASKAEAAASMALVPTNEAARDALHATYRITRARSAEVRFDEYGSGRRAGQNADIGHSKLDQA